MYINNRCDNGFFTLSGLIDDFVLPPEISDKESRIIDFPAPVSPVKTDSPFWKLISICWIRIRFLIDKYFSIIKKVQNLYLSSYPNQLLVYYTF